MKISFDIRQHTHNLLLSALIYLLIGFTPVAAFQASQNASPEIRYIDRSKGERNRAFPVSPARYNNSEQSEFQTGDPMLWRIAPPQPDTGIRSSYIFGTIHIDDRKVMDIPDSVLRRLATADTLILELELNETGSVNILRKMVFTDGRNLKQVIGEDSFEQVSTALADSGNTLPGDVLSVLKPWAAMLLLIRPENSSGTFLDKKLADIATQAGIHIEGLETIDEQLSVFDDLPLTNQIGLLNSAINTLTDKKQAYRDLLDAYLSGDMGRLTQVSQDQEPEDRELARLIKKRLIYDRNSKMFDRLQKRLQAGNVFIAVGALHLPGDKGLLNELRQAGYRLSRVGRE